MEVIASTIASLYLIGGDEDCVVPLKSFTVTCASTLIRFERSELSNPKIIAKESIITATDRATDIAATRTITLGLLPPEGVAILLAIKYSNLTFFIYEKIN